MRVLVPLFEGFEEIEAMTLVDVLRRAGLDVETAGLAPGPLKGAHGVRVLADRDLSSLAGSGDTFDAVVLPGGAGTARMAESPELAALLRAHAGAGKWTAAICAAPGILHGLGLLEGRAATSYPSVRPTMTGVRYSEDRVVVDPPFVTSRGPGTAMAFALDLVGLWCGPDKADELRAAMVVS